MNAQVRQLLPADAEIFREIRLEALTRDAEAFASTFDEECVRPLSWFEATLSDTNVFGAFLQSELQGTASYFQRTQAKERHKAVLWGVYVRPQARNSGVGRALMAALLEHAARRVELIQLGVTPESVQARRLYERHGFVEYGLERNAFKLRGRYYDDILMAKVFTGAWRF